MTTRIPAALIPAVCFIVLLAMGIVMLYPGRYHDGAAGRTVCAIAGGGLAISILSLVKHMMERARKRRHRNND